MADMTKERYDGRSRGGSPAGLFVKYLSVSLTTVYMMTTGCDATFPGNGFLRYGQAGEIRVSVETPLQGDIGWLQSVLTWKSDGAWKIFEEIGYQGTVGDEHMERNPGLPIQFAASYATLITQLNDHEGAKLFGVANLDPDLDPQCPAGASRVTVLVRDSGRGEQTDWTRCADGALATLKTEGSGPDTDAARVIQAAITARNWTVGEDFQSRYSGSLPFATVEKGTETSTDLQGPRLFLSPEGVDPDPTPEKWAQFWAAHTGGDGRPLPEVDWVTEMVLVGAVGIREEVGDSVEVRRVLQIGDADRVTGTKIEVVERIPGDFCAPARRIVRPYHIVVTRKAPNVFFAAVQSERVPCGAS